MVSYSTTINFAELWLAVEWEDEERSFSAIPLKMVVNDTDVCEGTKVKVKYKKKILECTVLKKGIVFNAVLHFGVTI